MFTRKRTDCHPSANASCQLFSCTFPLCAHCDCFFCHSAAVSLGLGHLAHLAPSGNLKACHMVNAVARQRAPHEFSQLRGGNVKQLLPQPKWPLDRAVAAT
ncbi:unnamed protein product [Effrenium voratum]|nr:unnamed protein product [Effrenium voratum]